MNLPHHLNWHLFNMRFTVQTLVKYILGVMCSCSCLRAHECVLHFFFFWTNGTYLIFIYMFKMQEHDAFCSVTSSWKRELIQNGEGDASISRSYFAWFFIKVQYRAHHRFSSVDKIKQGFRSAQQCPSEFIYWRKISIERYKTVESHKWFIWPFDLVSPTNHPANYSFIDTLNTRFLLLQKFF